MRADTHIDQKLFERIEHYLDGRMDAEEVIAFEIKMGVDSELRQEVELIRDLRQAVEIGGMRNELERIHKRQFKTESSEQKSVTWSRWKIAATVLVILGIGALLSQNSSSQERLFAENVTIDPGLPVTMGVTDEYTFSDGMVSYKEGNYKDALSTWETIASNEIARDKLTYYRACAYFNLEEYKQALPLLTSLVNDPQSGFHDKAVWYACLSYLQLQNDQQIQSLSPREVSPYYDRVEAIKQELSK